MTKRLNKSEFILSYMIIITLACFVGGFFLGAGYMKSKIDSEMTAAAEAKKEEAEKERQLKEQKLYKDQDFVRFYYNVFEPVQEVKKHHEELILSLSGASKKEQISRLKEMRDVTNSKLKNVQKEVALASSPLLGQAKAAYIKSLQSYVDGVEHVISDDQIKSITPAVLAANLQLFQNNLFKAETYMYQATALWESVYVTKKGIPSAKPSEVTVQQWNSYPFHYRAYLAAEYQAQANMFHPYEPLDLVARIDSLIHSEQSKSLGLTNIPAAIRMLEATDAVRSGDFETLRGRLYANLRAPETPLYNE